MSELGQIQLDAERQFYAEQDEARLRARLEQERDLFHPLDDVDIDYMQEARMECALERVRWKLGRGSRTLTTLELQAWLSQ